MLDFSGTVSATHFVGDGSGLTGIVGASSGGNITIGTTKVTTNSTGYVSFTTGGITTGYMDTSGRFVLPGVSTTGAVSATNLAVAGSNPSVGFYSNAFSQRWLWEALDAEMIGQAPALSRNEGTSQANTDLIRQQYSAGVSETARYLPDPSEVMRLPGRRPLILYRSDILRYPVPAAKINYRSFRHWYWWRKYDAWLRNAS